ncbi:MAG: EamA family transporter [Stackebrandtia sp.]
MTRAVAATVALAPISWGTTFFVTTELLPADRPLFSALTRALPAGLLLLAAGHALPKGVWWGRAATIGALNTGVFFALLFIAAYRLPGGVAAVAGAIGPLVAATMAIAVLKQTPPLRSWPLGVAGVFGVALVVLTAEAKLDLIGVAAACGGTVCMTTASVLAKRWGPPPGVNAAALAGWQLVAGGILLAPAALLIEGAPPPLTGGNLLGYGYVITVGTAAAYWLWFRGLAELSVVPLTFLSLLAPLTAAVVGWVALGQALTPLQLAGMAVAFGAVLAAQLPVRGKAPGLVPRRPPVSIQEGRP